jgi:hypothetical protein
MEADIGTNPPASAGVAGVQDANPSGYEADAGASDADQGLADQSGGDLPEGEEGAQVPELDEVEHEGLKHQIPKALREVVDKGLDYTRKTQELADAVRTREQQFAEREQQFAMRDQAAQVLHQGRAALVAMDLQLKQYEGVDWIALANQDSATANQHFMKFQTLKDQRQQIATTLSRQEQHYVSESERVASQRIESEEAKWAPEERQAVLEAARAYGLTRPVLLNLFGNNPGLLSILKDAALHRAASKTATAAAAKPRLAAVPQVQPAAQLPQGGRNSAPRPLSDPTLSDAEWNRRRNEQLRRSRRR